jgi:hypothetical protein
MTEYTALYFTKQEAISKLNRVAHQKTTEHLNEIVSRFKELQNELEIADQRALEQLALKHRWLPHYDDYETQPEMQCRLSEIHPEMHLHAFTDLIPTELKFKS